MADFDDEGLAAARDTAAALDDVLSGLEARSRAFGAALTGAFASAARGGKGLDDVLRGVGLRLTDIALSAGLKPVETMLGQAIGGFFSGGVTPFAKGGVVAAPTYFPLAGGTGLAGEAGPEAILPLRRGSDGTLGVSGGSGGAVHVTFNVTTPDAGSFLKSEGQVAAMLARTAARGRRAL
ncbi:phage tail tape measure protein [Ensifer soli]|uniref:phage tail tape measure protein n=1 Tax=Ciceribacter sp. sgz301302 TaxID=3342379 RepID=UPI0035BB7778